MKIFEKMTYNTFVKLDIIYFILILVGHSYFISNNVFMYNAMYILALINALISTKARKKTKQVLTDELIEMNQLKAYRYTIWLIYGALFVLAPKNLENVLFDLQLIDFYKVAVGIHVAKQVIYLWLDYYGGLDGNTDDKD